MGDEAGHWPVSEKCRDQWLEGHEGIVCGPFVCMSVAVKDRT